MNDNKRHIAYSRGAKAYELLNFFILPMYVSFEIDSIELLTTCLIELNIREIVR